ncbi:nucleoside phosphorylase domain-containing protein [Aspergillus spectabilis]
MTFESMFLPLGLREKVDNRGVGGVPYDTGSHTRWLHSQVDLSLRDRTDPGHFRMLEEIHNRLEQNPTDYNTYILGSIAGYNVVIAGLHQPGNNPAASVGTQIRNTFPNIRFLLLVGFGGGVPVETDSGRIRLGVIASGELIIKDAFARDHLAAQCRILCFVTEAAGAVADSPCLVIRGISDYCDSHKNDMWHGYAAATAAAYARELVMRMPIYDPKKRSGSSDLAMVQAVPKDRIKLFHQIFASGPQALTGLQRAKILSWLDCIPTDSEYHVALYSRPQGTCS